MKTANWVKDGLIELLKAGETRRFNEVRQGLTGIELAETDLSGAALVGVDLSFVDLNNAQLSKANLREANLEHADLRGAILKNAYLRGANLRDADLRRADLTGADIDFSCLPLWCGSFDIKMDEHHAAQLLYHFCRIDFGDCPEAKEIQQSEIVRQLANKFHRIGEGTCKTLPD